MNIDEKEANETPQEILNELLNEKEAASHSNELECSEYKNEPTEAHEEGVDEKDEGVKGAKERFEALQQELSQIVEPEQKLQKIVEFMELTLAQKGTPHFKSFWESRNLCIELFKQNIPAAVKQPLWNKYSELSKEARRLREILDEQSAFAAEQIEIAIQALEKEISAPVYSQEGFYQDKFSLCKSLSSKLAFYDSCQVQLDFLNTQAARINALRKELIKTNMRIRTKNKFFQRLSLTGDWVFPKRKDLIKEVSQNFIDDVENFIKKNFSAEISGESLFYLREEIKALQGIAKELTLNTHAFTHTRLRLSECWDKVKSEEKDRKKIRSQQKVLFKQNYQEIHYKIKAAADAFAAQELSLQEVKTKIDEMVVQMRQTELGHEEVKALKQEMAELRGAVEAKLKAEEQIRLNLEEEKERIRRKSFDDIVAEISDVLSQVDTWEVEALTAKKVELQTKIAEATLNKKEKQDLEKKLKPIQDLISEKKEKAILSLSEDDRHARNQLMDLLKEKKERRQEIKTTIELLRKSKGSSRMDFEQAMQSSRQMEIEREQLEKVNASIEEIESKLAELGYN